MKLFNTFVAESTTARRDLALKVHTAHSEASIAHFKKKSNAYGLSKTANELSKQLGKKSEEFQTEHSDDHGHMMAAHDKVQERLERRYRL